MPVCPTCGHSPEYNSQEEDPCISTHDSSLSGHHTSLPEWFQNLEEAIRAAWSARTFDYTEAAVLMLSWAEVDQRYAASSQSEMDRLQSVFQDAYHYQVEQFQIPSVNPDIDTLFEVQKFIQEYGGSDKLLIVYYAGHGKPNPKRGNAPVWYPRHPPNEDDEELDSSVIHTILSRAKENSPDVLLLHDCCNSLFSHSSNQKKTRATVECLFAGGFESRVPIAGPDSFTHNLIQELGQAAASKIPISVIGLHSRLIQRLQDWRPHTRFDQNNRVVTNDRGEVQTTKDVRVTPAHLFLSANHRSIVLFPIASKKSQPEDVVMTSTPPPPLWPKVMIAVRLQEDSDISREIQEWLLTAPPSVVEFSGFHRSFSTLLLVEVPVPVWDMLPENPAVSFVSFVREPFDPSVPNGLAVSKQTAFEPKQYETTQATTIESPRNQAIEAFPVAEKDVVAQMQTFPADQKSQGFMAEDKLTSEDGKATSSSRPPGKPWSQQQSQAAPEREGQSDRRSVFDDSDASSFDDSDASSFDDSDAFQGDLVSTRTVPGSPSIRDSFQQVPTGETKSSWTDKSRDEYRWHRPGDFQPGKIFKTVYSAPAGREEPHDEILFRFPDFCVAIRRFIVIYTVGAASMCVPIVTYGKKGYAMQGVQPIEHGIIHESRTGPMPLNGELGLGFKPIVANIYSEDEKLAKDSRVKYSESVWIQHNAKIHFIGYVVGWDIGYVQKGVTQWNIRRRTVVVQKNAGDQSSPMGSGRYQFGSMQGRTTRSGHDRGYDGRSLTPHDTQVSNLGPVYTNPFGSHWDQNWFQPIPQNWYAHPPFYNYTGRSEDIQYNGPQQPGTAMYYGPEKSEAAVKEDKGKRRSAYS